MPAAPLRDAIARDELRPLLEAVLEARAAFRRGLLEDFEFRPAVAFLTAVREPRRVLAFAGSVAFLVVFFLGLKVVYPANLGGCGKDGRQNTNFCQTDL